MTADDAPILDDGVIAELRASTGDDDDFVRELVEAYIEEGRGYIAAMNTAAAAADAEAMVRPAHTLKSSSATMGAMRLAAICRGIEEAARDGENEGLAADVDAATAAWSATLEAMAAAGLTA
ncbi:MAG TPA: Hpt domain-containing protein [Candidatus Limnocylindrales bacterium]|jgi:HPt (histidine-containing phosphotransfer) domain-containing protein